MTLGPQFQQDGPQEPRDIGHVPGSFTLRTKGVSGTSYKRYRDRSEEQHGGRVAEEVATVHIDHTPAEYGWAHHDGEEQGPSLMGLESRRDLAKDVGPEQGQTQGQMKLFGGSKDGGYSVVDYAEASKGGRVHFGSMLGTAYIDTVKRFGHDHPILPDSDLSPHSERIVNKAKDRGAVDPGFEKSRRNNMQFLPEGMTKRLSSVREHAEFRNSEIVTPQETRAGRGAARALLGKPRRQDEFSAGHQMSFDT